MRLAKRRSRRNARDGVVLRNVAAFPRTRNVTFVYSNTGLYAESAAGTGFQGVWALNGLYDMDITHPGHQPMYYDQLLTINGPYARYLVTKVEVLIDVINTSAYPIVFGTYAQPGAVDFPSILGLQEKPMGRMAVLAQSPAAGCRRSFRFTVPIAAVFGVPPSRIKNDDTYTGVYNANPSQIAYMTNMIYGITNIATATVRVTLRAHAKLFSVVAAPTS